MNEKITNYPIIEALCEVRFAPSQGWDITFPGIFYEKVKNEFPIKEQQVGFGVAFSPKEGTVEQKVDIQQRIRFWRKDKSAVIQLGPNLLAINQLRPYLSWEAFKPIILDNLKIYIDIVKPQAFNRIVLRYINLIPIENYDGSINEYFNFYPSIPPGFPKAHGSFSMRVDFPIENDHELLLLNFSCSSSKDNYQTTNFRLELNYVLKQGESLLFESADNWMEKGKKALNNAFKACITEKCMKVFKGDEHGIARVQ